MAAVAIRVPRPKMTLSAVQGRISVVAEDGERIGQWGGTECFLSRQPGLGPCLVVRSTRHKRHQGTFFQLARLERVVSTHVAQGRLTVMLPHEKRQCSVFVDTTDDLDELRMMAGVLQDKARWKDIERSVASKAQRGGRRDDGAGGVNAGGLRGVRGSAELRDPAVAQLTGRGGYDESDEEPYGEEPEHDPRSPPPAKPSTDLAPTPSQTQSQPATGACSEEPALGASARVPRATQQQQLQQQHQRPPLPFSSSASRTWTREQQRATQLVRAGRSVFVSGAAGTGKTEWLLHVLHHVLPRHDKAGGVGGARDGVAEIDITDGGRIAVTAATGIAARLLGGSTVHAFAGIGRGEGDPDTILHRVQSRADVVRAWQQCEVLVIDEISMLPAHIFALLDRIARVLRAPLPPPSSPSSSSASPSRQRVNNAALPFGGLQLLVVGDFLQLPPVSRGAGEEAQPAFTAPAWRACHLHTLLFTTDYRHAGDDRFAECCAAVRRGECTPVVREVLGACVGRALEERLGVEATTLMSRRKEVDRHNAARLQQLEAVQFQRYASEDYAAVPGADIDSEVSLPAVLTLKEGAQVVFLASLPSEPSLANGDVGLVIGFVAQTHGPALPLVRFTTGVEALVPAITMEVYGRDGRLALSRRQVPLQLAWALTVHRVQGMTLPMVRLALDKSFFEAGQAYVALSRVRRAADLSLTALDLDVVAAHVSTAAKEFYGLVAEVTSAPTSTTRAAAAAATTGGRAGSLPSTDAGSAHSSHDALDEVVKKAKLEA